MTFRKNFEQERVINGSYGEVWINSEYVASLTKCEAKEDYTYADVKRPRNIGKGKKLIEKEGSGSMEMDKISSVGLRTLKRGNSENKQTVVEIMVKLDDPDAFGAEQITLKNCVFQNLDLFNFEAAAASKEKIDFFFEKYEIHDYID